MTVITPSAWMAAHDTRSVWLTGFFEEEGAEFGDPYVWRALSVSFPDATFVRGDANTDGSVDLSDAVALLGYLFLGNEQPACLDAGDANDDGSLNVSDAIATLGMLFLGEDPLPAPFDSCGADETPDDLTCVSYQPCLE